MPICGQRQLASDGQALRPEPTSPEACSAVVQLEVTLSPWQLCASGS